MLSTTSYFYGSVIQPTVDRQQRRVKIGTAINLASNFFEFDAWPDARCGRIGLEDCRLNDNFYKSAINNLLSPICSILGRKIKLDLVSFWTDAPSKEAVRDFVFSFKIINLFFSLVHLEFFM